MTLTNVTSVIYLLFHHSKTMLGWHEEQKVDCRTPLVCLSRMSFPKATTHIFPIASPSDQRDETRACKITKDRCISCYVLPRFHDDIQYSELPQVNECDGA